MGAYGSVPRVWSGETVVCIASGPSLSADDLDYCRGRARVLVINTSLLLAPWADAFHACDRRVWKWHADAVDAFQGLKFSMERDAERDYGEIVLKDAGDTGLSSDPTMICNGRNSGYQAINISTLAGASRVVLLGYDMQVGPQGESHWHGDHPNKRKPPFQACLDAFATLVRPLADLNVSVVNCTRRSALTVFPQMRLEDALR